MPISMYSSIPLEIVRIPSFFWPSNVRCKQAIPKHFLNEKTIALEKLSKFGAKFFAVNWLPAKIILNHTLLWGLSR